MRKPSDRQRKRRKPHTRAEEKAELERLRARSKETLIHDIEAHRAKKAELAAKQAKLAELQKQLAVVLAETDAIMQSQQAPVMPGDTKLETPEPQSQPTYPNGAAVPTGNIEPRCSRCLAYSQPVSVPNTAPSPEVTGHTVYRDKVSPASRRHPQETCSWPFPKARHHRLQRRLQRKPHRPPPLVPSQRGL